MRNHLNRKVVLRKTLGQRRQDPCQPGLWLHWLTGVLVGIQAVSVTHAYRLPLILEVTEREIVLLDIGSLDEVY